MQTLPCSHREDIVGQVEPTKQLLSQMDVLHPDILRQHGIEPRDYHSGLVFRSAVESLRGRFIASANGFREKMVADVLELLRTHGKIANYADSSKQQRHDFQIELTQGVYAAIEVKGGEGNSINISRRPLWAHEFGVWCHLDGAIVNSPGHGARAIINRITNELVRDGKRVDFVLFKDILCGTRTRPCPKYGSDGSHTGLTTAPDVFLFPRRVPVYAPERPETHDASPPPHSLSSLSLPNMVLDAFAVPEAQREHHVWQVQVEIESIDGLRRRRRTDIHHQGQLVGSFYSRSYAEDTVLGA